MVSVTSRHTLDQLSRSHETNTRNARKHHAPSQTHTKFGEGQEYVLPVSAHRAEVEHCVSRAGGAAAEMRHRMASLGLRTPRVHLAARLRHCARCTTSHGFNRLVHAQVTRPVAVLKAKTAHVFESWLATRSHWPLLSNWKWRGVSPRVWKMPASVSMPGGDESRWTRCTATESWPRLEVITKSPVGWMVTRPHVFTAQRNAGKRSAGWQRRRPRRRALEQDNGTRRGPLSNGNASGTVETVWISVSVGWSIARTAAALPSAVSAASDAAAMDAAAPAS